VTTNSFQAYDSDAAIHRPRPARRLSQNLVPVRRNAETENVPSHNSHAEPAVGLLKQQLKATTNQLKLAQQRLSKNQLDLRELTDSMSHELRTPLRAISGFSSYLKQEYEGRLDEAADEYINLVVDAATRMEHLISDLVQYSRATTKPLTNDIVDLNDLLADALVALEHLTIDFDTVEVCGDLPKVRGDYRQLTLLLQNLIENGLKFNDSESPKIRIQVQNVGDQWRISVCDNGIGIKQENLESVFDLFRRLNLRSKFAGEGAGLSICRRIVEHHSGKLWLESEEGVGTKAIFSLPSV